VVGMAIRGGKELERKLLNIERKVAKKVVRKAVRVGQKSTLAAAKTNAKSMIKSGLGGEGELGTMGSLIANNLKIVSPKQRKGSYRLSVGIDSKANDIFVDISKAGKRNYIPAAIEFGHGSTKEACAIPFMRNANAKTEGGKVGIVTKELRRGILAAAK
jgi:hypothetical protein